MEVTTIILIITTITAAIVAFIGLLQYLNSIKQKDINEQKLKLDFFDRRFKVYQNTKDLLNLVKNDTHGERRESGNNIVPRVEIGYFKAITEFKRDTASSRFLFEDDAIHEYVEKINKEAEVLHKEGYQTADKYLDSREWLLKQLDEIENIFAPHLKFDFEN